LRVVTLLERINAHAGGGNAEATALEWSAGRMSYRALAANVHDMAQELRRRSVSTLAIDLDNGPAWALVDLAALEAGCTIVPIPPFFCAAQVRHCIGQARVLARLRRRAAAVGIHAYEGYGLSECASVVCLNTPESRREGSVGRVLPHARLRIVPDGEVMIRGASFVGYLGDAASDDSTRWWASGDLGHLDQDGYLYLSGRRRSCFISGFGRNIAPEWVECELLQDPAIAQAAVFGEARPWNAAVLVPGAGVSTQFVAAAHGLRFARPRRHGMAARRHGLLHRGGTGAPGVDSERHHGLWRRRTVGA
jgi:long-subunit acyl-CoA synthetase (AMP-forming)